MGNVSDDHAPTSPPGAAEHGQPMDTQPTLLERATLAAKRRAEGGSSPPVSCMQQPTKQLHTKITTLTVMYAVCALLVTVRAVRNAAGGQVRTHHGSVTREKTCNELCMSHSSQEINITCTYIRTVLHSACCATSAISKLSIHTKHAQTGKGGASPKAHHDPLTCRMQLLNSTTHHYTYHISHPVIITCGCSRVVTAADGIMGGF